MKHDPDNNDLGAQYNPSKFLLARQAFIDADNVVVVDLDAKPATMLTADERKWLPDTVRRMIPMTMLRYVGPKNLVLERMVREPLPGFRYEYGKASPDDRYHHSGRSVMAVSNAAPINELLKAIGDVRIENLRAADLSNHRALFGKDWLGTKHFGSGEALVVNLGKTDEQRLQRWHCLVDHAVGHLIPLTPDFMPCDLSTERILLLFERQDIQAKEHGIAVSMDMFRHEARKRLAGSAPAEHFAMA